MDLVIRRYRPKDKETVKAISYAGLTQMGLDVSPEHLARYDRDLDTIEEVYLDNRGDFLVGTLDHEIVVMGGIRYKTATCGEIKRIRVRRECQRRGCASLLLKRLISLAPSLGYEELVLDTLTDNYSAQRLFESCGFVEIERGTRNGFSLVFYWKKLERKERVER